MKTRIRHFYHAGILQVVVGLMLLQCLAVASSDSTQQESQPIPDYILFVGRLNLDAVPDTVKGYLSPSLQVIPSVISWGIAQSDTSQSSRSSRSRQVRETVVNYPQWRSLRVSLAIQDINADTLSDLIFYLRGDAGDSTERRDTMRAIVVFGQHRLDSLAAIDLAEVSMGFQEQPFFAMDLRKGVELEKPSTRDMSRGRSFMLQKVTRNVRSTDTTRTSDSTRGSIAAPLVDVGQPEVMMFPNPTESTANVEIRKIPAGSYQVLVFSVNGQLYHQQDVVLKDGEELLRTVNVQSVPTGYYVLQLHRDGKSVASYPVVVVH